MPVLLQEQKVARLSEQPDETRKQTSTEAARHAKVTDELNEAEETSGQMDAARRTAVEDWIAHLKNEASDTTTQQLLCAREGEIASSLQPDDSWNTTEKGANMRMSFLCVVAIGATLASSVAQDQAKRGESGPPPRGTARLYVCPALGQIPGSLKELCNASSVIVEGIVQTTLLSRETSPGGLETDAVISVARTLKGPATVRQIMIAQRGGVRGEFSSKPVAYAVVQPGEHYLLFLTEDKRPKIPEVAGIQRYLITGIWSGLFYFEGGKMRVSADEPDMLRKKYEGLAEEQVIGEVSAAIRP